MEASGFVSRPVDFTRGAAAGDFSELDAVTFDVLTQRLEGEHKRSRLRAAAFSPLLALINQNAEGKRALAELAAFDEEQVAPRTRNVVRSNQSPPSGIHDLVPGRTFVFPAYDLERQGPSTQGHPKVHADRLAGTCGVTSHPEMKWSSIEAGSASLGIVFFPSAAGIVHVRPYTKFHYGYSVWGGWGLSAHSEGSVWMAALTEDNAVLEHVEVPLFSQTSQTDLNAAEEWGVAWPFELSFPVKTGPLYKVFVGVSVGVDQSGSHAPPAGSSGGSGELSIEVPWFVIEI